jgi:drug/metabolite transporter (DMT)-like permease
VLAGATAALLAALSFGVTAPLIALVSQRVGPLAIASLLYGGAAASSLLPRGRHDAAGAPFGRAQVWRLVAMAAVGGGAAPALFAWGLRHTGGTAGSLLLNLEAVFTVLLAWLVYREPIGRRVAAALTLMALGGGALALDAVGSTPWSLLGVATIVAATLGWAVDNTLSRGLAQQAPVLVIGWKGALGAIATATAGYAAGEQLPPLRDALLLLGCGASGYGLSLRLYLLAQRRMGAARTGSIFAVAPFMGAALGWALGDRDRGHTHAAGTAVATLFFAGGLWLHLTERHHHAHVHAALEHDHPHRHDDGHHDHVHDPPFQGEHSHVHRHERVEHDHDHAPDIHHDHVHS